MIGTILGAEAIPGNKAKLSALMEFIFHGRERDNEENSQLNTLIIWYLRL